MPPLKRKRRVPPEESVERRRKTQQQRKRRFGAIKKLHGLKKFCNYEVAGIILNPETGQIYTYRSSDNEVWRSLFEKMERTKPAPEHFLPQDLENLLNKTSTKDDSGDDGALEDEDDAREGVEPHKPLSGRLPYENSQNFDSTIALPTALPEKRIPSVVRTSARQSLRSTTNMAEATRGGPQKPPSLPSPRTSIQDLEATPPLTSLHASPVAEIPADPPHPHNRAEAPGAIAALPGVDSPTPDNIHAESQIPHSRNDNELSRLREEHSRVKERKSRLLELNKLDEEEDRLRRKLEELERKPINW